jgi:hypothetical protein
MTILIVIKLFLYLTAFGPMAVLFASVIGLACGLLMVCVRAIAWLVTIGQRLGNSANVPKLHLRPPKQQPKLLQHQL